MFTPVIDMINQLSNLAYAVQENRKPINNYFFHTPQTTEDLAFQKITCAVRPMSLAMSVHKWMVEED